MFTKTRTLLLFGVTSLAIATGGCVVESGNSKGDVLLDWEIEDAAGQLTTCSAVGATTVRLVLQRTASDDKTFDFACSEGAGLTTGVAPGTYTGTVSLLGSSGALSQTTPQTVVVYKNDTTDLGTIIFQVSGSSYQGKMGVDWELRSTNQTSITCASANAAKVDLDVQAAGGQPLHFSFDCDAYAGISSALPPGSYVAAVRLYDAADNLLSEAQLTQEYAVGASGTTDLGKVIFLVTTNTDQFLYLNWVIHKCADTACSTDQPGEFQCPSGSTVVMTVDGTPYDAVACTAMAAQTTTLTPGTHDISIKLMSGSTVLSQFPASGSYPIDITAGVPYGAQLIFAIF